LVSGLPSDPKIRKKSLKKKSIIPEGIIPPLLTPLTENQEIDVPALKILIQKMIDAGIPALFICGSAGLGSALTMTDYEKVIVTTLKTAPEGYPVLCGVLESSTMRALERIRLLESLHINCFVTVVPYYLKATKKDDLLRHFGTLRESTDMEMVLYNMPACTGVNMDPGLVFEMAERGWSDTIKDSSGNKKYFEILCKIGIPLNLRVYQGLLPDFHMLSEIHASGCVPLPANIHPELFISGWESRADKKKLARIQPQINKVWNDLIVGTDFTSRAIKQLAEQNIGTGTSMLPFNIY
jgi:4-hydroxy-tetrahydrodipicolinate synthase